MVPVTWIKNGAKLMRKALKDKLNNIQWVSAVSSQRKAQYADIADEWLDRVGS